MVKVNNDEFYMDGILKDNLDYVKPHVLKDWDMCFIFSGIEGGGKSTLCFQVAKYLAGDRFTLEHICFSPQEFMEKIRRKDFLKPGDCLVLDESFMINSKATMSELNRKFLAILSECRQKQLFLLMNVPNFFDLDRNLALWRSRGLFYIYHDSFERGYFRFFNYEKKKQLFVKGKKFFNYNVEKPDFIGRFTKYMPVDAEEYKKLKLKAFEERPNENPRAEKYIRQRDILVSFMQEEGYTYPDIVKIFKKFGVEIAETTLCDGAVRVRTPSPRNNNDYLNVVKNDDIEEEVEEEDD